MRPAVALLFCPLLAAAACAQHVSATTTPDPAAPGVPIVLDLTDATGLGLAFCCPIKDVRAGSPNGVPVFTNLCNLPTSLPPHGVASDVWNQTDQLGQPVPPGDYWIHVQYMLPGQLTLHDAWFPVTVTDDPDFPTLALAPGFQAAVGQPLVLALDAPRSAHGFFAAAASLTTDAGLGGGIHLDADPLFLMTALGPTPPGFQQLRGFCDAAGQATGIGVELPPAPWLRGRALHFQAAVEDTVQGTIAITNSVHLTIH